MPKEMDPHAFIKTEHLKKPIPGATWVNPTKKFSPGWYWFAYRPVKHGPFNTEAEAKHAGVTQALLRRNIA